MEQINPDQLESLEEELNTWRRFTFDRLITRHDPLPALREAVKRARRNERTLVRLEDVRALLMAAVDAVDKGTTDRAPASERAPVTDPAVIREIFGLTMHSRNALVEDRQRSAGQICALSVDSMRKHNREHVEQLAMWIRDYLPSLPTASTEDSKTSKLIGRADDLSWLQQTHRQLLKQRQKLFLIWGLAGSGKTTLAHMFAQQIGPEKLTGFVHIGRRGLYEEDIRRILLIEGKDVEGWSDEQCLALFRMMVRQLAVVRLIVLDDVREKGDVSALLPLGSNVPVLITARERVYFDKGQIYARQIRELSIVDTVEYLRGQLPELNLTTARRLARMSGGHAETIAHIVHYLMSPEAVPAESLLAEFQRGVSATLTNLNESIGIPDSLKTIVERLFRQLPEKEYAWAILACVVWTNELGDQSLDLVVEMLTEGHRRRPTQFQIDAALSQLERLGLLARASDWLHVPRLTSQVLRDLLIDSFAPILILYERVISVPPGDVTRKEPRFLHFLRQEYEFAGPMRERLAADFRIDLEPKPAFVRVDMFIAIFATVAENDSDGRSVNLFRSTPTRLVGITPGDKHWKPLDEKRSKYLAGISLEYAALVMGGFQQDWTPEEKERFVADLHLDIIDFDEEFCKFMDDM